MFVLAIAGVLYLLVNTADSTLFTSGLTGGFILVGVSALALLTYPAYREDVARTRERGGAFPSVHRYVALGIGIPVALGVLFEIAGGGGMNVPGFMAMFVAAVVHPFVAFVATLVYLVRRRRVG